MIGAVAATATSLSHVYPIGTRVNELGRLEIGGCDAVELAREFGTPAYVVAEDDLRYRARTFVDALSARHSDYDVLFASKAFPGLRSPYPSKPYPPDGVIIIGEERHDWVRPTLRASK